MASESKFTAADLDAYLAVELPRLEREADPYRITHTVQVTSFGGSGTTAICRHFIDAGVDLQPGPGQWPFKHWRWPPTVDEVPDGFRVVYIVGDPRDAVLSIFRRNYQLGHYRSLNRREPDDAANARLVSLDTFLAAGVDDFELADHLDRWLQHPPGYPVMFVGYDALPAAWPDVHEFVGLPRDHPPLPARTRHTDWRSLRADEQERLNALYGELATRIAAMPPTRIV